MEYATLARKDLGKREPYREVIEMPQSHSQKAIEALAGKKRLTLAVVGDTHYVHTLDQAESTVPSSAREYYRNNRDVAYHLLSRLRERCPDLIIHTGDVIEGHLKSENAAVDEVKAAIALFSEIAPTVFTKGNHDGHGLPGRVRSALMCRHHSDLLASQITGDAFAFAAGPAYFIITDTFCQGREPEQLAWLESELAVGKSYPRSFVFGHGPLYPTGRPFFTHLPFTREAAALMHSSGVDAYFCGHTHNQLVSLHWSSSHDGERPILQCKTSLVGTFEAEKTHSLAVVRHLPDPQRPAEYFWGILENGWPGWLLVTISQEDVTLEGCYWSGPETSTRGQIRWYQPGCVELLKTPALPPTRAFQPEDLARVRRAWLLMAGYKLRGDTVQVLLNGHTVGFLPPLNSFAPHTRLQLPQEVLGSVRSHNELVVLNPLRDGFCLGGIQLLLELDSGERVLSHPHPYLYTTSEEYSPLDHTNTVVCRHTRIGPIAVDFGATPRETAHPCSCPESGC